jgi:5-(carboxyamino)imidazole ribonucleotide mutase
MHTGWTDIQGGAMPKVAIFMGSISDEEKVRPCADILDKLGIDYLLTVTSAHRTPERTSRLVKEMEEQGCRVFICAAGLAAHLAGAVAAQTTRPVLGIPITGSSLGGWDALLATVQMPPGFPVGTLALDKVGAKNAAWLAAQIVALSDPDLEQKIQEERAAMREDVEKAAQGLE